MSIGYVCDPDDSVTLILSHYWTPIGVTTAKDGIRKLFSEQTRSRSKCTVFALDKNCNVKNWDNWIGSSHSEFYPNQPHMRSSSVMYPVPTIILTTAKWSYQTKQKPTVKYMYKRYRGVCQICGEKKPVGDMSIEHILPKSKHGSDDDFNVTLTCKPCNNTRGDIFPYYSNNGKPLEPLKQLPFLHVFGNYREEWKTFFVKFLD